MIEKRLSELRFLVPVFFLLLALMMAVTMYPFNFFSANGVQWLSDEPGLYFNGHGKALTGRDFSQDAFDAVSVELWLQERQGSKNRGPKEIFSFYDGSSSPSLLVGQWGGHLFLYSHSDAQEDTDTLWYKRFRSKNRFPKGKPHLVTVTCSGKERALYIDGVLQKKRIHEKAAETKVSFSGRLLIGNSPTGKNGWQGEVRGLALYDRVLMPEEIIAHNAAIRQKGLQDLAAAPGCLALYTFEEGAGNHAASVAGEACPLYISPHASAQVKTLFSLPFHDMRKKELLGFNLPDFLENIIFFIPFGVLLTLVISEKYSRNPFVLFLIVTATGGLLSLTIEFLQLFLPSRTPGLSDIMSNMVGSSLGVFVIYVLKQKKGLLSWLENRSV